MAKARRLHAPSDGEACTALCGWPYVQIADDPTRVTCKACLRLLGARSARVAPKGLDAVVKALAGELRPSAGPPPLLSPYEWAAVCRPDPETQQGRCGRCALCAWERQAERYAACAPWRDVRVLERSAWAFGSLNGALVALWEWRAHDRHAQSALGPMLDRIRSGETGGGAPPGPPRSRMLDRADDIAHVDRAVALAFEADNAAALPAPFAEHVLLMRTPGVVRGGAPPTYVEIAQALEQAGWAVTPRQLKRTVRHGRRSVGVELAARGLIRPPNPAAGLAEAIYERQLQLGA